LSSIELSKIRLEPGLLHVLIDELAADFAEGEFALDIASAREDYFTKSGRVFEDDAEVHELRTLAFLEWYVIERSLRGDVPPVVRAIRRTLASKAIDPMRLDALARLAASHRSLFDIADVDDDAIELEDILAGGRFKVEERRSTIGFEVGSIVEARLVWDGSKIVFTKTFLFHPRDARAPILDLVDESLSRGLSHNEIMFLLAQLYLRWHRHGHVNAARIYKGVGNTVGPVPL